MKNKIRVSQRETMILLISLLISASLTGLHLSSQSTLEKTENMETSTQTTLSELRTTTTTTTTTATSTTTVKPTITTTTTGFKPIIVSSTSKAITENTESVIETTAYKITECVTDIIETESSEAVVLTTEETPEPIIDEYTNSVGVSESEYILLCNCVAYEAGSEWISEYDKALVVEVIMNRVNSSSFPNDIYSVITQEGQFSGVWNYTNLGYYADNVSDSVKNAVDLYFNNPSQFNHGYMYFEGDGVMNYFS